MKHNLTETSRTENNGKLSLKIRVSFIKFINNNLVGFW